MPTGTFIGQVGGQQSQRNTANIIEHNPAKKEDKEFIKTTFDDSTIYRLSLNDLVSTPLIISGLLRSAVAVTARGSSNASVRELITSGVIWPAAADVEIPLYRRALDVETDEANGSGNGNGEHGEHTWTPRVLLPKYHEK